MIRLDTLILAGFLLGLTFFTVMFALEVGR
jgi:hypothetical protein